MRKVKLGGAYGRWPAYEVGQDDHGSWLFCPKGTVYQGHPTEGPMVEIEVGQGTREEGLSVLHLVAPDRWWIAAWYELDGVRQVAVDVCTPPACDGDEWSYTDLELDLHWASDGKFGVFDEDEFEDAIEAGSITPDEAEHARITARDALELLSTRGEPFGLTGWTTFDQSVAACLAPIKVLGPTTTALGSP